MRAAAKAGLAALDLGTLISYLGEAIRVGSKDSNITWLRIGIVQWNILFHSQM